MTDARWHDLVETAEGGAVTQGTMFGSKGLRTGTKFFAIRWHEQLVVKLPPARLTELVEAGDGEPFEPLGGRGGGGAAVRTHGGPPDERLDPARGLGGLAAGRRGGPRLRRGPERLSGADMDLEALAVLLQEAAETHHRVYRITDGEDPDWASWYADWLLRLSELPGQLGRTPVRSELVYLLVLLAKEVTEQQPTEAWEQYYARRMAEYFTAA